jgi:hypothetical protein
VGEEDVECPVLEGSLSITETTWHGSVLSEVSCIVPAGAGKNQVVSLARSKKKNFVPVNGTQPLLSYKPPVISTVSPSAVPTVGGVIEVTGDNFGVWAGFLNLDFGPFAVSLDPSEGSLTHTFMRLRVGAGEGVHDVFTLGVKGQSVMTDKVAYEKPVIGGIGGSFPVPTMGGTITITGTNLGRPGSVVPSVDIVDGVDDRRLEGGGGVVPSLTVVDHDAVNHEWVHVEVGEGQGSGTLHIDVGGNVASFEYKFRNPQLSLVTPEMLTTAGGLNMTIYGTDFGVGAHYYLTFRGTDPLSTFTFTAGSEAITSFNHTCITLQSPEGQSDTPMAVELVVSGQQNDEDEGMEVEFMVPSIAMLAVGESALLEPPEYLDLNNDCDRYSKDGCGLRTRGGYTVAVVGENFGVRDQKVYFNGKKVDPEFVQFHSHSLSTFEVPKGVGVDLPVYIKVGV